MNRVQAKADRQGMYWRIPCPLCTTRTLISPRLGMAWVLAGRHMEKHHPRSLAMGRILPW